MSFSMSGPLQAAVYGALTGDAALAGIVGTAIYDAVPNGSLPEIYVRIGPEEVVDASDASGAGALHRFTVSVITTSPGFAQAKDAAGRVSDALHERRLSLSRGRIVFMRFERARVRRTESAATRQIDLRFAARVQDD